MALLKLVVCFLVLAAAEDCQPDSEELNLLQSGVDAKPSLLSKDTAGSGFHINVKSSLAGMGLRQMMAPVEVGSASTRIEDVKATIQNILGLFLPVRALICNGKSLQNGHTLADYNIGSGSSCQVE
ncbi:unnamed protein product [Effrenium voratum]|nr:unnamed protein product [Effrenium voratum]